MASPLKLCSTQSVGHIFAEHLPATSAKRWAHTRSEAFPRPGHVHGGLLLLQHGQRVHWLVIYMAAQHGHARTLSATARTCVWASRYPLSHAQHQRRPHLPQAQHQCQRLGLAPGRHSWRRKPAEPTVERVGQIEIRITGFAPPEILRSTARETAVDICTCLDVQFENNCGAGSGRRRRQLDNAVTPPILRLCPFDSPVILLIQRAALLLVERQSWFGGREWFDLTCASLVRSFGTLCGATSAHITTRHQSSFDDESICENHETV